MCVWKGGIGLVLIRTEVQILKLFLKGGMRQKKSVCRKPKKGPVQKLKKKIAWKVLECGCMS